jgi:glycosyltransferase involved in cell wall biosynthesis
MGIFEDHFAASISKVKPLVTVLLCHNSLRHMVKLAIDSYTSQDYENRELVVIDDGPETIKDLVEGVPNCQYFFFPAKNLSEKRNFGARMSRGEIIVHFDADDWSGPHRVSDQVEDLMLRPAAQVSGYDRAYWYDILTDQASYYRGSVWSATMIYWRKYVLANPWDESCFYIEDGPFVKRAQQSNVIMATDGNGNFVATLHSRNARRSYGQGGNWPLVPYDQLPDGFKKVIYRIPSQC